MTAAQSFESVVAEWLRTKGHRPRKVTSVTTFGTDWAGDTEGGFYSQCDVTIRYVDADSGKEVWREVDGEDMGDLWQFVMKSWPEP